MQFTHGNFPVGLRTHVSICYSMRLVWQIGKTKVFLRAGQMAELDAKRAEVLGNAAKKIQRQIRTYIAHKEFVSLRKAAIQLQSCWRGIALPLLHHAFLSLH